MLDQRLQRWPRIKPTLGECAVFAGKLLPVNTCQYGMGVSSFELPAITQKFVFQPDAQLIALVESFIHRCRSSILTFYDLGPFKAELGMKRI